MKILVQISILSICLSVVTTQKSVGLVWSSKPYKIADSYQWFPEQAAEEIFSLPNVWNRMEVIRQYKLLTDRDIGDDIIDRVCREYNSIDEDRNLTKEQFLDKVYRFSIRELIYDGWPLSINTESKLDLAELNIEELDGFHEIPGIEKACLAMLMGNKLETISRGVLHGADQLEVLDLSGNRLRELGPGVFKDLSGLKVLNLSCNQIEKLEPGVLDGLVQLEQLVLLSNKLKKLHPKLLEGADQLQTLSIDDNPLDDVPIELLREAPQLCELIIDEKQLTEDKRALIERTFPGLEIYY